MATTTFSDLIDPEILGNMVETNLAGMSVLAAAGLVQFDSTMLKAKGGDNVKIPYWGAMGDAEVLTEGSDQTAESMSTSSETATVEAYGKLVDLTDWAVLQGHGDPNAEAARQFAKIIDRKVDRALIYKADRRAVDSSMQVSYAGNLSATAGTDKIAEAVQKFGDEEDFCVFVVHSKCLADLRQNDDFQQHDKSGTDAFLAGGRFTDVRPLQLVGTIYGQRPVFVSDLVGQNRTALSAAIDDAVVVIPVDSTAGFPNAGNIIIGTENILYTGRTAWSFTGCTRGVGGTAAASAVVDAVVSEGTASGVGVATKTYLVHIIKPGALIFYYQREILVEMERDISKRATEMAVTAFGAPHAYQFMRFGSKTGVAQLEVQSSIA